MNTIQVICVDDVPEIATLICDAIDQQPDMTCVESIVDSTRTLEIVTAHHADILVLDLTMPGMNPFDIIADVARNAAFCRVIAYSGYDDTPTQDAVFQAGGWGLVSKHDTYLALIDAIRAVMNNQTVFSNNRINPDV